jgi:hypothetical protein
LYQNSLVGSCAKIVQNIVSDDFEYGTIVASLLLLFIPRSYYTI